MAARWTGWGMCGELARSTGKVMCPLSCFSSMVHCGEQNMVLDASALTRPVISAPSW